MTKFIGGPAHGTYLDLRHAPLFLRVVIDRQEIDALDLPDDAPTARERIVVYRRVGEPGHGIVCTRGKHGGGRPLIMAEYRFYGLQPHDHQARQRLDWEAWCAGQQLFFNGPRPAPLPGQRNLF